MSKMRVLVIEDEPLIRDIFADFLELLGYEADVAEDGCDALERFDPSVHQIVLTDFLMPGMTGLDVAEAVRARSPRTSIVMISGSAELHDERRATGAGLIFLRKPITFADFKAALEAVVQQAGVGGSPTLGDEQGHVRHSHAGR